MWDFKVGDLLKTKDNCILLIINIDRKPIYGCQCVHCSAVHWILKDEIIERIDKESLIVPKEV